MLALEAVVVGPAEGDLAEHGVDHLAPVADELGLLALAAVDPLSPLAEVDAKDLLQEAAADPVHRLSNRQFDQAQPFTCRVRQAAGRERAEPLYFGRELRLEVREEPLFSSPVAASGTGSAAASNGRASQMWSLISTISSVRAVKRL